MQHMTHCTDFKGVVFHPRCCCRTGGGGGGGGGGWTHVST